MSDLLTITDFSPGLHTETEESLIPPGAMSEDGHDVVFDRGTMRVRPGRVRHDQLTSTTAVAITSAARVNYVTTFTTATHAFAVGEQVTIAGTTPAGATVFDGDFVIETVADTTHFTVRDPNLAADDTATGGTATTEAIHNGLRAVWEYHDDDDTLGAARFVGVLGNEVWQTTTEDQKTWSQISGATRDQYNPVRAAQFKDTLYVVDGVNAVGKWDPVNGWSLLTDNTGPSVAPSIAVEQVQHNLVDPATQQHAPGRGLNWSGAGNQTAHVSVSHSPEIEPVQSDVDGGDIEAACARQLTDAANCDGDNSSSIALELISAGGGVAAMTGWVYFEVALQTPIDLTNIDALAVRHFDSYGGTAPALNLYLSEDNVTWQGPYNIAASSSWATATLDISALTDAQKDEIAYIRIKVDANECSDVARKERDSTTYHSSELEACTIILDGIYVAPTIALTAQGRYEFTYSYDYGDGTDQEDESPAYVNTETGPEESLYPYVDVENNITFGFRITTTKDEGITANAICIYCRFANEEFMRIGRLAIYKDVSTATWSGDVVTLTTTSDHEYVVDEDVLVSGVTPTGYNVSNVNIDSLPSATQITYAVVGDPGAFSSAGETRIYDARDYDLEWDGLFEIGAVVMIPYIQVPPAACDILIEWKGRMVYALDDTLYISNWDNPERVPTVAMEEAPSHYGGWVRAGDDGEHITGLGVLGSYLLVFKKRGVYRLEGQDPQTFALFQLAKDIGCGKHETIEQCGGNLLAWYGNENVMAWDGQEFFALGAPREPALRMQSPIGPLLKTTVDAGQESGMFGVYDPDTQRYLLTIPKATAAQRMFLQWQPNYDQDMPTATAATDATDHGDAGAQRQWARNLVLDVETVAAQQINHHWTEPVSGQTDHEDFLGSWVSPPLVGQQIMDTGDDLTVMTCFGGLKYGGGASGTWVAYMGCFVYIWRPSESGYKYTLSASSSSTVDNYDHSTTGTGPTLVIMEPTDRAVDLHLRDGDRVVLEPWYTHDDTSQNADVNMRFRYAGADEFGDDADGDTVSSDCAAYIDLGASFTFADQASVPEATTFVFEMKNASWTRWTAQPNGCAVYARYAKTPGTYAGDLYGEMGAGYLYRMMTGYSDETSDGTGVAISWEWFSRFFDGPAPNRYKDVSFVGVRGSLEEPPTALTLALRVNGGTTDYASKAVTVTTAPGASGTAEWRPVVLADCVSYQLAVGGSSSTSDEVTRITAEVEDRGAIR